MLQPRLKTNGGLFEDWSLFGLSANISAVLYYLDVLVLTQRHKQLHYYQLKELDQIYIDLFLHFVTLCFPSFNSLICHRR